MYAVSVATGRFTTILNAFDIAFRTVIDHRTVELMRLAKKEFVVARLKTMDQYQRVDAEKGNHGPRILSYSFKQSEIKVW